MSKEVPIIQPYQLKEVKRELNEHRANLVEKATYAVVAITTTVLVLDAGVHCLTRDRLYGTSISRDVFHGTFIPDDPLHTESAWDIRYGKPDIKSPLATKAQLDTAHVNLDTEQEFQYMFGSRYDVKDPNMAVEGNMDGKHGVWEVILENGKMTDLYVPAIDVHSTDIPHTQK